MWKHVNCMWKPRKGEREMYQPSSFMKQAKKSMSWSLKWFWHLWLFVSEICFVYLSVLLQSEETLILSSQEQAPYTLSPMPNFNQHLFQSIK